MRGRSDAVGGLVDLTPLEKVVAERIPWRALRANLARQRPGALCISCTEVRSGRITVFQDGALADPKPWANDPNARAVLTEIGASHVRASAAIPFLFPAIRIGDHFYVDGGLRMNTPLTPALRLAADRVLVVALKHAPRSSAGLEEYPEESITQPAFLLGKVLNTLLLDQLEYELRQMELVNAWIERGQEVYGDDFLARMNVAVIAQRGIGYRHVKVSVVRPSEDVGSLAARCRRKTGGRELGALAALLTRFALRGVPEDEADLLSYLYFDAQLHRGAPRARPRGRAPPPRRGPGAPARGGVTPSWETRSLASQARKRRRVAAASLARPKLRSKTGPATPSPSVAAAASHTTNSESSRGGASRPSSRASAPRRSCTSSARAPSSFGPPPRPGGGSSPESARQASSRAWPASPRLSNTRSMSSRTVVWLAAARRPASSSVSRRATTCPARARIRPSRLPKWWRIAGWDTPRSRATSCRRTASGPPSRRRFSAASRIARCACSALRRRRGGAIDA